MANGDASRSMPGIPDGYEPTLMKEWDEGNASLDKIKELGVEAALYEHLAAFTVEEQAKALGSLSGEKTKNLFLRVSHRPWRWEEWRGIGRRTDGSCLGSDWVLPS